MTIEIINARIPQIVEFEPMANLDIAKLLESKEVTVTAHLSTKTRVMTSLSFLKFRQGINIQVDGFKQDKTVSTSMWTMNSQTSYYFKKGKYQGFEEYQKFVSELLKKVFSEYFKVEIDHLKVNLINNRAF